jgi:DNA-binding CsgD family transcriptional regulator
MPALRSLGWALLQNGQHRRSWETYEVALGLAVEANDERELAGDLIGFAWLAADHGQLSSAARLFAVSEVMLDRLNYPLWSWEQAQIQGKIEEVQAALGSAVYYAQAKAGGAMAVEEAAELALTIVVPEAVADDGTGLTPREREVLQLVVDGASDNEIADQLFITRRTASKHVAAIIEKLEVPNRTAAATAAVRRGLI